MTDIGLPTLPLGPGRRVYCSLGLPGAGPEFYDQLLFQLAAAAEGRIPLYHFADPSDDFAQILEGANETSAILLSRGPSRALTQYIDDAALPLLLVWRDPRDCVVAIMDQQNLAFRIALDYVVNSAAALAPFVHRPGTLMIEASADGLVTFGSTVRIAKHFGFDLTADQLAAAVETVNAAARPAKTVPRPELTQIQAMLLENCAAGYRPLFAGGEMGPICWPPELMMLGDDPDSPATGLIDLTGRFRCLVYGPFQQLPPGRWRAAMAIAVGADALRERFGFDVVTDQKLVADYILTPTRAGVYQVDLEFDVDNPRDAVQCRVFNRRASFEGHIMMGEVTLTRLGPVSAASGAPAEDFAATQ